MPRKTVMEHLNGVPSRTRAAMLAEQDALAPGAACVVGRFFRIVQERREPLDAPSMEAFGAAATSRSTLRTLLATLARHAPDCSTAAAQPLVRRFNAKDPDAPRRRRIASVPVAAPADWPLGWRLLYPGLCAARIAEGSKRRHLASIRRCATLVPRLDAGDEIGFLLGEALGAAFLEEGL